MHVPPATSIWPTIRAYVLSHLPFLLLPVAAVLDRWLGWVGWVFLWLLSSMARRVGRRSPTTSPGRSSPPFHASGAVAFEASWQLDFRAGPEDPPGPQDPVGE